jgi:glutaconate CoA-transferase subunit A
MPQSPLTDLEGLAAVITDGMMLAVPKDSSGVAMAATRVLARRGVRGLHLVCVPTSGLQAEIPDRRWRRAHHRDFRRHAG